VFKESEVQVVICDMDCLHCKFSDCVNDSDFITDSERRILRVVENSIKRERQPHPDMTRYIHNRIDKEEYEKARNREYEQKRSYKNSPKRRRQKKEQYHRHREEKLAYQKGYYERNREEVIARQKAYYEANKEEINRKRREKRKERKRIESLQVMQTGVNES
jgi:hypothetical protein